MVMRNRKKEALEFLTAVAVTAAYVWTFMWIMIVFC